ncbi:MAG: AsmA family protein [Gammaproteobacteria bacterium]|nr:AsmA family protein [Gammaproteobacteria bacterium]
MNNVKLSIRAKEGDIRLDPVVADLYGGKYQGVVTLDAKGKVPQLQLSSQLNGVQLEPLLKDYSQKPESPLAGIANISAANLSAKGSDAGQLKQSLTGQEKFQVEKGVLKGIDVRKTLEAAEVLLESKQLGTVKQGGETAFDQLSGTLDINNGVVMNKDLLMKAPGFQVTGDGMLANLHDNTIKYNLQVGVEESRTSRGEKQYNLGGYKIPIKCRGKLNAIESACQPDLEGLAAVALKKGIQEKIEEQLGEKLGIKLPGTKSTKKITPQQLSTPKPQSTQEKVVVPAAPEKQSQEVIPQEATPQQKTPAQETAPALEIQPAESEPKDQIPQEAIPLQEPQQQEAPLTESQQQTTQEQKAAPTQQQTTTEPQSATQEQTTTQQQSATTENQEEKKEKTPEEQLKEGVEDLLKGVFD